MYTEDRFRSNIAETLHRSPKIQREKTEHLQDNRAKIQTLSGGNGRKLCCAFYHHIIGFPFKAGFFFFFLFGLLALHFTLLAIAYILIAYCSFGFLAKRTQASGLSKSFCNKLQMCTTRWKVYHFHQLFFWNTGNILGMERHCF